MEDEMDDDFNFTELKFDESSVESETGGQQKQFILNNSIISNIEKQQNLEEFSSQEEDEEEEEEEIINKPIEEVYETTFKAYEYQLQLFLKSKDENSIIFLETGRGKTLIGIMHIYYQIKKNGADNMKIAFLANTIQLVEQQCQYIKKHIFQVAQYMEQMNIVPQNYQFDITQLLDRKFLNKFIVPIHSKSGQNENEETDVQGWKEEKWEEVIQTSCVLVMMGQMLLNGLRRGYLKLKYFSLIIFDECHHCNQHHSYRLIISEFGEDPLVIKNIGGIDKTQILGLTATPVLSIDIEKAIQKKSINSRKIKIDLLQLALNMHSKYQFDECNSNQQQFLSEKKNLKSSVDSDDSSDSNDDLDEEEDQKEYKFLTFLPETGISSNYIANQTEITEFYQQLFKILMLRDEVAYSMQLLLDQLYHYLVMYGLILYQELGTYSFYQFFKQLKQDFEKIASKLQLQKSADEKVKNKILDLLRKYFEKLQFLDQLDETTISHKVIQLINELKRVQDNEKKILIFVDHKITSKYLNLLLEKHDFSVSYVVGTGNLTSGALQQTILRNKNQVISLTPNQNVLVIAEKIYNEFNITLEDDLGGNLDTTNNNDEDEAKNIKLRLQLQETIQGIKDYGKILDQTATTSQEQQKAIKEFKESKNILVSTNVTEEGFDVPSCHYVFIFGAVSTLKQYVQKTGRAREKNSIIYIIIPEQQLNLHHLKLEVLKRSVKSVKQTIRNIHKKNSYQNAEQIIIKLQKEINPNIGFQKKEDYYESRIVRGNNALLNTNWAVEILSNYANLFRNMDGRSGNENYIRGIFTQYTEYPSLGFKCVLILPKGISDRYFVGDLKQTKDQAKRSAAFKAIIKLRQRKQISDDLRPEKNTITYTDRKNDPNMKDPQYSAVIQESVIIKNEIQQHDQHQKYFPLNLNIFTAKIDLPFYLYKFKFYELQHQFQHLSENVQKEKYVNIGFISNQFIMDRHTFIGGDEIRLEKINQITLTEENYQLLYQVHKFLIATTFDWDITYYQFLTKEEIKNDSAYYQQRTQPLFYDIDDNQKYQLLVLLTDEQEDDEKEINYQLSQEILKYVEKMKDIFTFNNSIRQKKTANRFLREEKQRLNDDTIKLQTWNKLEYDGQLVQQLKKIENIEGILVQDITDRFHMGKFVIVNKKLIQDIIQEKNEDKKQELTDEITMMKRTLSTVINFKFDDEIQMLAAKVAKKYMKAGINANRKIIQEKKNKQQKVQYSYFSGQFYKFPINYQTLFQLKLIIKYIMEQLRDILISLSFKKHFTILMENKKQEIKPNGAYQIMNNIVITESLQFVNFIEKEIVQIHKQLINNINIKYEPLEIIYPTLQYFNKMYTINDIDLELLHKSFQSQQYNQDDRTNYQVLEFLGDAILKLLSSIQIFIKYPFANENLMHVERARIVSNENLRKRAVIYKFFQFILCSDNIKYWPQEFKTQMQNQKFSNEKFQISKNGEKLDEIPYGYQPIPEKVHSDVIEALNGAFFIQYNNDIGACQYFLHKLGILEYPTTEIKIINSQCKKSTGLIYDNLTILENIIGYKFNDQSILIQALTSQQFLETLDYYKYKKVNCSIIAYQQFNVQIKSNSIKVGELTQELLDILNNQQVRTDMSYERLEFLGDSVLDCVVVEWLYQEFKNEKVEDLALKKQCVVCNKALALVTLKYQLEKFLLHPSIHDSNHDNYQTLHKIKLNYETYYQDISKMYTQEPIIKILGDIFEAIIGAIFVDSEFNYILVKKVVLQLMMPFMQHFTSPEQILKNPQHRLARYFKDKNEDNIELILTDEEPKEGQNEYILRNALTFKVFKKVRATSNKQALEKILEQIAKL